MTIAFAGMGLMGAPMAQNFAAAGHKVLAYNRTAEKAEAVAGGRIAASRSIKSAVENSNAVIAMLSDFNAIEELFVNRNIDFSEKTFIQMSTIKPEESVKLKSYFEAEKCAYLEAPVLGSIPQIKSKSIITIIGGGAEQYSEWKDFFLPLGEKIVHAGNPPSAAALKLALNQLIASLTVSFSASLGFVRESNSDVNLFMEILRESALYAPTFDKKLDRYLNDNYENPNFPLKHLLKDVKLIRESFGEKGINLSAINGAEEILEKGVNAGYGDSDYSALYKIIHK